MQVLRKYTKTLVQGFMCKVLSVLKKLFLTFNKLNQIKMNWCIIKVPNTQYMLFWKWLYEMSMCLSPNWIKIVFQYQTIKLRALLVVPRWNLLQVWNDHRCRFFQKLDASVVDLCNIFVKMIEYPHEVSYPNIKLEYWIAVLFLN